MCDYFSKQVRHRKEKLMYARTYDAIYSLAVPEVFCAVLVRVGNVGDGGKWVCNPFKAGTTVCNIFSLGVNNDISFEKEIWQLSGRQCNLFCFDKVKQNKNIYDQLKNLNATFKLAQIDSVTRKTFNKYSIQYLMRFYNISAIEIFKIDIEDQIFCQVLIEIHGTPKKQYFLLKLLSRHGYYLFSYEVNGYTEKLCEYSFIHESCIQKYSVKKIAKYLS
ncbi:unnamed protein product [Dracunculus medinensis]|uniref:Methyltranfer_dom domain-containing protein n=1 Tax=Dracunculus medinensis TaxID=318479 RepID=A0A0N4U8H1_DRAME|nr:unnamed protein product [Dracunculus medinensis]